MIHHDRYELAQKTLVMLGRLFGTFLLFATVCTSQQPQLAITSPADGTVVNPGQMITVAVTSPAGLTFTSVGVIGTDPFWMSDLADSVPAQSPYTVPTQIACGSYLFTAHALRASGQTVQSDSISIDVERPDLPLQLTANIPVLFMDSGTTFPLSLSGNFSDGSVFDVSGSSYMSYGSNNISAATVDGNGVVTAVATGTGTITATYTLGTSTVSLSIPFSVSPSTPLMGSNFTVSATPSVQSVTAGNSASYQVSVVPVAGFSQDVTLTLSGFIGTSGSFNPAVVSGASGTSTLTVSTTTSLAGGTYPMQVIGASGSAYANAALQLNVTPSTTSAPLINSISPTSGVTGSSVIISGKNFGPSQGTGAVAFGTANAQVLSWDNTQIVADVPSAATGNVNVTVAVGSVSSNGFAFSVARGAPSVANVSPTSGPVGTVITISGANFGASQGNGYVTVGPVLTAVTSWSNTQIVATVPNISNGSENVQVEVGGTGGTLSNAAAFTVTIPQPAISSLSPTSGLAGTSVTITGTKFGAMQGYSYVEFGAVLGTVTSWSNTQIVATVPNISNGTVNVQVSTGAPGTVISNTVPFTVTVPTPNIASVSPTSGPVGTSVTVTGTNFGASQGAGYITIGAVYGTVTSWSNTQIVATVPNISNGTAPVQISVGAPGSVLSNSVNFTVTVPTPSITGLSPTSGPVGTSVTVTGANFGATQGTGYITIGAVLATVTSWNNTQIVWPPCRASRTAQHRRRSPWEHQAVC